MSIVSSVYEMDAGRHVVERHTDSEGQQYVQTWFAPLDWTTAQIESQLANHAQQIADALAQSEIDQELGSA